MDVKNASRIRRRDDIPPSDRTQERDRVAEYIERLWPETFTTIAEEADCSRQLVSKTAELYFEPANEPPVPDVGDLSSVLDEDEEKLLAVFRNAYRMGWRDRDSLDR